MCGVTCHEGLLHGIVQTEGVEQGRGQDARFQAAGPYQGTLVRLVDAAKPYRNYNIVLLFYIHPTEWGINPYVHPFINGVAIFTTCIRGHVS